MKIKEVIIVEGKSDTQAIQMAVEADTIETIGSALPAEKKQAIMTAAQTRGIIVFTDPDFNGERLRKMITALVPDAKHAFLTKKDAGALVKHHSLGIEYATTAAIQNALLAVATTGDGMTVSDVSMTDLRRLGLVGHPRAAQTRERVSERLGLGYVNGKQLLKRLQMFGITLAQLEKVLEEHK